MRSLDASSLTPRFLVLLITATFFAGCAPSDRPRSAVNDRASTAPAVRGVDLNNPIRPTTSDAPITLSAAKNEWVSFSVQLSNVSASSKRRSIGLKISALRSETGAALINKSVAIAVL